MLPRLPSILTRFLHPLGLNTASHMGTHFVSDRARNQKARGRGGRPGLVPPNLMPDLVAPRLSFSLGRPVAGGRPGRRLAARPHPPEQAGSGGRIARLHLPPR